MCICACIYKPEVHQSYILVRTIKIKMVSRHPDISIHKNSPNSIYIGNNSEEEWTVKESSAVI